VGRKELKEGSQDRGKKVHEGPYTPTRIKQSKRGKQVRYRGPYLSWEQPRVRNNRFESICGPENQEENLVEKKGGKKERRGIRTMASIALLGRTTMKEIQQNKDWP